MMMPLRHGRYLARLAATAADLQRAQVLRHRSFLARRGLAMGADRDEDPFDAACEHILVEDSASGALVCCFRLMTFADQALLAASYSAQSYDLAPVERYAGAKLELGRFCLDPDWHDPDILRLAWGAMARTVTAQNVRMLFGCSSFESADPGRHAAPLALLQRHIAPVVWRPRPKAPETYPLANAQANNPRQGLAQLPPLLRSYLGMGGFVSDHAVIDRNLDTLHVFTAVEVANVPPARARALRLIAGSD